MKEADVLVIGGGPAGTTAASALASRGWTVILADRAVFPRAKPCGDYCNPGAVTVLESLGLLPAIARSGAGFIEGMTVVGQDGFCFQGAFPGGPGALIRRERLDALLLGSAVRRGVEVVENFHVDDVRIDDQVTVRNTLSRRALRARLLIAADGMHSSIARRLGLLPRLPDGRFTVGAYFSGVSGAPAGELHLGSGLYGGVARFGDGTANVCLALPRRMFRSGGAAGAFAAGLRVLPVLEEAVAAWAPASSFRVTGPIGFAHHPVSADRVMLAGDAAGQVEPLTGQGISFALRSGLLAAEEAHRALAGGDLSARSLRAYDRRRRRALGPRIRAMRAVNALALHPPVAGALIRRLATRPFLRRRLLGATGDLLDARAILSPGYVIRLLLAPDADQT